MKKINYAVLKNEKLGRYLVTSKDIKAGELILCETPTLIGPPIAGILTCFNCCKKIKRTAYVFCSNCSAAVLCNGKCTGTFHTKEECDIFKNKNINGRYLADNYQIIFPLRCLLLKIANPELWVNFMELESHVEERRNTAIWRRHQITVENILKEMDLISEEDLKTELMQKICGILDVNTFEVRPPNSCLSITNPENQCLRGLYIQAALMAHDCTGNTLLSVDDDYILRVKASVDIPKDSLIFFNYANAMQGSVDRKQHLKQGKYFECSCTRCNDPTELNTNISSLKCHKCTDGFVRTLAPNDLKSDWTCCICGKKFVYSLVNIIVEEGRRLIQECNQNNVSRMEKLYSKLLKTFHPNHYLLLDMQQNMIGLYSLQPPTIINLKKKIDACQNLLRIISVVEPGISRMKALTLYQLQSAMIDLAHKNYSEQLIPLKCLLINLKAAEDTLVESIKYLLHEPTRSPEGIIARTAMSELKDLRTSMANIKNDLLNSEEFSIKGAVKEAGRTTTLPEKKQDVEVSKKKKEKNIKK